MAWFIGIICGVIGLAISGGQWWAGLIGFWIGAGLVEHFSSKKNPLSLQVARKHINVSEIGDVEVIEVKLNGLVYAPHDNTKAKVVILAHDCTSCEKPEDGDIIATSNNIFSSFGNGVLSPAVDLEIPYESSELQDWVYDIPLECMTFPYRGERKITFAVFIQQDGKENNALAFASESILIHVDGIGYMEYEDYRRKAEMFALDVTGIFAYGIGTPTLETWSFVKQWIVERVKIRNDEDQDTVKALLEGKLKSVRKSAQRQEMLNTIVQQMKENLLISDRFEFATFFIKLVATFENITEQDIKRLDSIAGTLEVDMNEFHAEKQKHLPVSEVNTDDPFLLLGIDPDASSQEKRKKLNELFLKWNNLAIHKDEKIRKKAEKMLDLIADCKKRS